MNENSADPAAQKTSELPRAAIFDLKAAREARGLSLQDIFSATRISLINLSAMESGDFDRLPPPIYTRSFLRKYAGAIGVDEKEILNRYERYLESTKPPREATAVAKPPRKSGRRRSFLLGGLAVAIVAGLWVFTQYPDHLSGRLPSALPPVESAPPAQDGPVSPLQPPSELQGKPSRERPPAAAMNATAKVAISAPQAPSALPSSDKAAPKPLHLIIEARELTWARITEDRSVSAQVLLKPGERIERRAAESFQLDIGNAGGIDVIFQGKPLGSLGKRGQVIHLRLPAADQDGKMP